jgi:hypothetical protein
MLAPCVSKADTIFAKPLLAASIKDVLPLLSLASKLARLHINNLNTSQLPYTEA